MKQSKFYEGPIDKSKCKHTPGADNTNYSEWHEWWAEMSKMYKATQCENCGLWSCWVKK